MGQGGVGVGESERFASTSTQFAHAYKKLGASRLLGYFKEIVVGRDERSEEYRSYIIPPIDTIYIRHTKFGNTKYANYVPSLPNGRSGTVIPSERGAS